ncbi:50S ribosomal protein L33 [Trichoderma novae-zelandiae]
MAKKAKARLLNVRLISMAMTGFFYTFKRPRTAPMMGMLKYDPIGMAQLLTEQPP